MAIWGGGLFENIMKCARHRTLKNAQVYSRDSYTLKEAAISAGFEASLEKIVFRSPWIASVQHHRSLTQSNSHLGLHSTAHEFVTGTLQWVKQNHINYNLPFFKE